MSAARARKPLVWFSKTPTHEDRPFLLCFPYAGAGASAYRPWASSLPSLHVVAVQLAGREDRLREQPLTNFDAILAEIVEAFVDEVASDASAPFSLYGHSFGALLAFELARELRRRGVRLPSALIVSGARAPQRTRRGRELRGLSDPDFIAAVSSFGGIPREVLDNPAFLRDVLPAVRADITAGETYRYRPGEALRCPIVALAGAGDERVNREECEAWGVHAGGAFRSRVLPGSHFFIKDPKFPAILREELEALGILRP